MTATAAPSLFDPDELNPGPRVCPVCGAQRQQGDNRRAAGCAWDTDRAAGGPLARMPNQCVNRPDPTTDPFPPGY